METKKNIRTNILAKRDMLSESDRLEKSRCITSYVISHPTFLDADELYCFIDFRTEVCTRFIIEKAWELGKRVAAPKVNGRDMEFYYFTNFEELLLGCRGILEPPAIQKADSGSALVIMPGAAFDRQKNRIGYGGGFYDRYLEKHPALVRLAVAFTLQYVDYIPAEPHDLKPDILVTENGYM